MKLFNSLLFFFCICSFAQKKLPPRFSDFQTVKDTLYMAPDGFQYKIKIKNITERWKYDTGRKKTIRGEITLEKKARIIEGVLTPLRRRPVVIPYQLSCDCLLIFSDMRLNQKKNSFHVRTSGAQTDSVLTFFWEKGFFRQFVSERNNDL